MRSILGGNGAQDKTALMSLEDVQRAGQHLALALVNREVDVKVADAVTRVLMGTVMPAAAARAAAQAGTFRNGRQIKATYDHLARLTTVEVTETNLLAEQPDYIDGEAT